MKLAKATMTRTIFFLLPCKYTHTINRSHPEMATNNAAKNTNTYFEGDVITTKHQMTASNVENVTN